MQIERSFGRALLVFACLLTIAAAVASILTSCATTLRYFTRPDGPVKCDHEPGALVLVGDAPEGALARAWGAVDGLAAAWPGPQAFICPSSGWPITVEYRPMLGFAPNGGLVTGREVDQNTIHVLARHRATKHALTHELVHLQLERGSGSPGAGHTGVWTDQHTALIKNVDKALDEAEEAVAGSNAPEAFGPTQPQERHDGNTAARLE